MCVCVGGGGVCACVYVLSILQVLNISTMLWGVLLHTDVCVLYISTLPISSHRFYATAMHLLSGKQGDILRLPAVKYLDPCTNLFHRL